MQIVKSLKNIIFCLIILSLYIESNQAQAQNTISAEKYIGYQPSTEILSAGSYDVIIVGAGTSGVSAAIEAARQKVSVALIEETDWVGGQATSAGVASMDEDGFVPLGGIYGEFIKQVKNYYNAKGLNISTCYYSKGSDDQANSGSRCFEPRVGQKIYRDLLDAAGVHVFLDTKVISVTRQNDLVTGIVAEQTIPFGVKGAYPLSSKILIDATEYGDLLPLAGIPYRVGNIEVKNPSPSTSAILSKSSASSACVQDITYTAVMKKYTSEVPIQLRADILPPPSYDGGTGGLKYTDSLSKQFSMSVDDNAPPPPSTKSWPSAPTQWLYHLGYRGMPNSTAQPAISYSGSEANLISKTGINDVANDWNYSVRYIEDPLLRKQANCRAKLRTLQFIYYIEHDLKHTDWAIANDEGYNTAYNINVNSCFSDISTKDIIPQAYKTIEQHLAIIPYIRESRRIIGIKTLTGKDIYRNNYNASKYFPSSVAVGDYANDLHGCNKQETLESSLNETIDDVSKSVGRFQIPFETLIPQKVDGFLAAEKNISQSRLANAATRLQPTTMYIGQAAGRIASYAVQHNLQPRNVNSQVIQSLLAKQDHQQVSLFSFPDVPLDNPYWGDVQVASASELMTGEKFGTLFGVGDITRAEAAIALERRFSFAADYNGDRNRLPEPQSSHFADVLKSDIASPFIEKLYGEGITSGCAENPLRFCPNSHLTREQAAILVTRLLKLNLSNIPKQSFNDVSQKDAAYPYINAAVNQGLMPSFSNSFSPHRAMNRGEFAALLTQINFLLINASASSEK